MKFTSFLNTQNQAYYLEVIRTPLARLRLVTWPGAVLTCSVKRAHVLSQACSIYEAIYEHG